MRVIRRKRPIQQEVVIALARTADELHAPMSEVLRAAGLSVSQYNVLRILRGAGQEGLPCGEISARMVRRDPDLTRLLDKLEARGLVGRARGTKDRRVVTATITGEALKLLESLDEPVQTSVKQALAHVPQARLRELLEILDEIRTR
jgi:DNA-binding MarR family transcriptional regulator